MPPKLIKVYSMVKFFTFNSTSYKPLTKAFLALVAVVFMLTFNCFAQSKKSSSKQSSSKKANNATEAKLTKVEAPLFDEKQFLAQKKGRIISDELLKEYERVVPGYSKKTVVLDAERHTFTDNNDVEFIIGIKEKYNIKDPYIEELVVVLNNMRESKLSPEEKKLRQMRKEEEERQKALLPVAPSISNE